MNPMLLKDGEGNYIFDEDNLPVASDVCLLYPGMAFVEGIDGEFLDVTTRNSLGRTGGGVLMKPPDETLKRRAEQIQSMKPNPYRQVK